MMRKSILTLAAVILTTTAAQAAEKINMDMAKRQAAICTSCHFFNEAEGTKVGPNLYGVLGRKAGTKEGYMYSDAMKAQKFKWDKKRLDKWLTNPKAMVPGTKMSYPGTDKPEIRKNIIAWVESVTTPPKKSKK